MKRAGFGNPFSQARLDDWELDELYDFDGKLRRDIARWKNHSVELPVLYHPLWPDFHHLVVDAVSREWGASFILYRGMGGGRLALRVIEHGDLPLAYTSSWTWDEDYARRFAKDQAAARNGMWVVVAARFRAQDVAFAGIRLPRYELDPNVRLYPFGSEDEVVIISEEEVLGSSDVAIVDLKDAGSI